MIAEASAWLVSAGLFAAIHGAVLLLLVLVEMSAVWVVVRRHSVEGRASDRRRLGAMVRVMKVTAVANLFTLAGGAGMAWLVERAWTSAPKVVTGNPIDRMVMSWKLSPHEGVALATGLVALTALVEWVALECVRWRGRRARRPGARRYSAGGAPLRRFVDQLSKTPERRFGVVLAANAVSMPMAWEVGALIAGGAA